MKKFLAKIIVKIKPNIDDKRCQTLKTAIETIMPILNLSCDTGVFYLLSFSAKDQCEALNMVEKIAKELLSNESIETYEIKSLEEVYDSV